MRFRPKVVILVTAIASPAIVSCGNGQEGITSAGPALSPPVAVAADPPASGYEALLKSPLAAYMVTDQQSVVAWNAMRLLRISCVRAKGFTDYDGADMAPAQAISKAADAIKNPAGPWGYLGAENAAKRGFQKTVLSDTPNTPVDLPADVVAASGACFDQATAKLTPPAAGSNLVRKLESEATDHAVRDSRVAAARDRWSACMAAAGFTAKSPEDLADKAWGGTDTQAPSADEIATARADEKCATSSELARIYFPVEWGYQRALIDRNRQALNEYQKQLQSQAAEAARIVASGDAD